MLSKYIRFIRISSTCRYSGDVLIKVWIALLTTMDILLTVMYAVEAINTHLKINKINTIIKITLFFEKLICFMKTYIVTLFNNFSKTTLY